MAPCEGMTLLEVETEIVKYFEHRVVPKNAGRTKLHAGDASDAPRSLLLGLFTSRGMGISKATRGHPKLVALVHSLGKLRPAGLASMGYFSVMLNVIPAHGETPWHTDDRNTGLNIVHPISYGFVPPGLLEVLFWSRLQVGCRRVSPYRLEEVPDSILDEVAWCGFGSFAGLPVSAEFPFNAKLSEVPALGEFPVNAKLREVPARGEVLVNAEPNEVAAQEVVPVKPDVLVKPDVKDVHSKFQYVRVKEGQYGACLPLPVEKCAPATTQIAPKPKRRGKPSAAAGAFMASLPVTLPVLLVTSDPGENFELWSLWCPPFMSTFWRFHKCLVRLTLAAPFNVVSDIARAPRRPGHCGEE
eukprot:6477327-Amphidinium_carterae.2